MSQIQLISLMGSCLFMGIIIYAIYKEKLQEAYAIVWLLTGLLIITVSISGRFLEFLAKVLGIQTPAFAILLVLLCGILLLLLQLTVLISQQQKKLCRLAEEIAILHHECKASTEASDQCKKTVASCK